MNERKIVYQSVDMNVENLAGGKMTGVENTLINYATFIPPEPYSAEAMQCPRESCGKWVYRDNKECEYCKYDLAAYWYRIDRERRKAFFDKRVSQIWCVGLGCLALAFVLLQFTSSLLVGVLFIVGMLAVAAANSARFEN